MLLNKRDWGHFCLWDQMLQADLPSYFHLLKACPLKRRLAKSTLLDSDFSETFISFFVYFPSSKSLIKHQGHVADQQNVVFVTWSWGNVLHDFEHGRKDACIYKACWDSPAEEGLCRVKSQNWCSFFYKCLWEPSLIQSSSLICVWVLFWSWLD